MGWIFYKVGTAKTSIPNLSQEGRQCEPKHSYQTRTKAFEIVSLPSRLIQRRSILPFHGKHVFDSKMMVEGIRPKRLFQIWAKKEGRANQTSATKHVRKPLKLSLSPVDRYKAELSYPSRQKRSWFEDDGRRHTAKTMCPNLRQEGSQGEPKHGNQTRTKAFEIISLPRRLIQRRSILPFHGKSVLDSKMMVGGIRPKRLVEVCAKKEVRENPNTYESFVIIFLPSWLIQRRTVLPFHGKSVLDFEDDDRRYTVKPLCPNLRQEGMQDEPNHVQKPLKLSLFLVDWYKGELAFALSRQKRFRFQHEHEHEHDSSRHVTILMPAGPSTW